MWLEPQRGRGSKDSSLEDEVVERERERRAERWRERRRGGGGEGERRGSAEREEGRGFARPSAIREREGETERPERGRVTEREGVNVDGEEEEKEGEEAWGGEDKRRGEPRSDSTSGRETGRERNRGRGSESETDNSASDREEEEGSDRSPPSESDGGSERVWEGESGEERDRILSVDSFVTLSSGGEEAREEFEDCKDFWDVARNPDVGEMERGGERGGTRETEGEEGEGKAKDKHYVFCVIGQTLPRPRANRSQAAGEESEQNPGDDDDDDDDGDRQDPRPKERDEPRGAKEERADEEEERGAEGGGRGGGGGGPKLDAEHPYAEIGQRRHSDTEILLREWRERVWREKNRGEGDPSSQVSSSSAGDEVLGGSGSDGGGALSPEEQVAIRIRMSGAWSTAEEAKRLSQAPHLKWAKNVVREILGASLDPDHAPPAAPQGGGEGAGGGEEEEKKGGDEKEERTAASPVYAEVQKTEKRGPRPEGAGPSRREEEEEEAEPQPRGAEDARDEEEKDFALSWGEVDLRNVADTITRKRNSKFFIDAQLYQQYSETAQNREILRQSRSDVLSTHEEQPARLLAPAPAPAPPSSSSSSPPSSPPPARRPLPPLPAVPHPHSLSHSGSFSSTVTSAKTLPLPPAPPAEGRPSSPRLSISKSSPSLWQDLPGVRNSAELGELSEDERRLQEVRFEVITSEASYCRSLDIVVEHFVKSKQLGELLTTQDRSWLFSRLADVRAISHSFLSKLEERVESNTMHFTVCDIIARHCQRFKMVYVPYLTNQSYQDATYQRLMDENHGFRRVVEQLERNPVCQRLPLRSFLILPFQRITRIKLLVQNIVKRTAPGTEEEGQAIKAMKQLEKLIRESNDSITQMKSIESLVTLSARVDFECRTLPLVSQSRRLVREGAVTELMDFSLKDTERSVYLHLFNDYLLLSLHKEGGRFTVIDHAPVSDLRAENCRVKLHSLQKNLFRLHLSRKALLLRTDTQSDKLRWISAVSRPHPVIDYSAAQDFTQMQGIRAFVAQQPDEMSLEKADVILVHQQSSDGWVEGTKLSDRQRGWAPESHLETITSPRACERNLLDALKITTATAAM